MMYGNSSHWYLAIVVFNLINSINVCILYSNNRGENSNSSVTTWENLIGQYIKPRERSGLSAGSPYGAIWCKPAAPAHQLSNSRISRGTLPSQSPTRKHQIVGGRAWEDGGSGRPPIAVLTARNHFFWLEPGILPQPKGKSCYHQTS